MKISVIIPAYNEEAGIARLLTALVGPGGSAASDDIEVIVVPNGCTDATAEVARSFGVRVVELSRGSKTAALNAADAVATGFPRVYLDADIPATPALLRSLRAALAEANGQVHAAIPQQRLDVSGSSPVVRAYYRIHELLPVFEGRVFGRGQVVALSEQARGRFEEFPEIIADDMFLDAMVRPEETRVVAETVTVRVPRRTSDLVRRLARSREGNAEFYAWVREQEQDGRPVPSPVRSSSRWSWLRDVVAPRPRLWPAAAAYVGVILAAEARRRLPGWTARSGWGQRS